MQYWRVCLSWVWQLSYGVFSPPSLLSAAHLWLCFKNLRTSCRSLKKIELGEDLYRVFKDFLDSGTMTLYCKESCFPDAVLKKRNKAKELLKIWVHFSSFSHRIPVHTSMENLCIAYCDFVTSVACRKSYLDVTLVSSSNESFKSGWSCVFV